jgi:hypothetical protein
MKGPHKSPQKTTMPPDGPRPLSVEQRSAIDLLCTGMTDTDVAAVVGKSRETVWGWRHEVPLFMAELEKARQQYISGAVDKLRSTLPKAVETVVAAVAEGNLRASLELLRIAGLYGNSAHFQPGETDPEQIAMRLCMEQLAKEGIKKDGMNGILIDLDRNPRYDQRKREILEDLHQSHDKS